MDDFIIEYRHCIAYAKALTHIGTVMFDECFTEENDIFIYDEAFYHRLHETSIMSGIYARSMQECRVGCFGALETHCLSLVKNVSVISLDGDQYLEISVNDLDYSEEAFFQNSLVHNRPNLFYITVFSYLYKHCFNNFSLESNLVHVLKFCDYLREEIKNTDYYNDLMELLKNSDKYLLP